MINDCKFIDFKNLGIIIADVDEEILMLLKSETAEIQKNFSCNRPHNQYLAGNILHEYVIENHRDRVLSYVKSLAQQYELRYQCLGLVGANSVSGSHNKTYHKINLSLSTLWVNFQKKYEFNPMHTHNGIFSFVIWLQIPYFIELERSISPGRKSLMNKSGCFEFIYTDIIGNVVGELIEVDKKMEGKIALFPARLNHTVYPFFSSDDFRISISGNLYLDE
jgi:hypothetical protein